MNSAEFLPLVSVVVPVYNGETDLPDLIECLRSQTYPTNRVEYLLVDNKSRDYTSTILQAAAKSPKQEGFNQITIRNLTENTIQSSYAARNKGMRASTGEIIAFTDADCRPEPQWLQNLVEPFANLEIGITCGEILALPGNTLLEKHAARENTLSQKHTLAHPFCPYGGDADLCWRILRETSYKMYFAENAIARHRHRNTIKQLQSQWHRYGESNKYLHELHGVDLMREFTTGEYLYRLARWLLKELPVATAKCALAKPSKRIARADLVDLLNTPIGLLNVRARAIGQRQAKLPELAREIERL
ncbi:MAG: glycosyltransferase family 2 protein [Microcoleus sp. PH2017_04_SCI_O_A]|nr:glycosyltransferase family 2 protein [Microcoleus sp. PH2017_04_SCI_O_A]